jgi:hypothetical protein
VTGIVEDMQPQDSTEKPVEQQSEDSLEQPAYASSGRCEHY